jgi:ADP-ribose pyrophosphatase YjhB (NUDIX family)
MGQWIDEDLFREIMRAAPICTVDVVFFNADATACLVFRRTKPPLAGQWFTLGGRLLKGERILEGALRQAREEAGLTLEPGRLVFAGVFDEIHDESRFEQIAYHAVNICWAYSLEETASIRLDSQHDRCAWMPVADPAHPPMLRAKLLGAAERFRAHDRSPVRPHG